MELASRVPSEPPHGAPNAISVVFKLPSGARIERRFLTTDSLQVSTEALISRYTSNIAFSHFPGRLQLHILSSRLS